MPLPLQFLVSCSQDEADAWFKYNQTKLPTNVIENRPYIETMTGCIPLLLKSLIGGVEDFDRTAFLENKVMAQVVMNITFFYETLFHKQPPITPRNE
jgi:hypothetical protein